MKNYLLFTLLLTCSVLKGQTAFQHITTAGNISNGYMTSLTHPNLDGNKEAVIIIMPIRGANNTNSRNDAYTKNYGVWYNAVDKKWKIFTEDRSAMTLNMGFNVLVAAKRDQNNFSFTTTQQDITAYTFSHGSLFSSLSTDGKEDAIVLVTHNGGWGTSPNSDNNSLLVSYSNAHKKWGVAHHDYMAYWFGLTNSQNSFMKPNTMYNVMVVDSKACSPYNMIPGFTNANAFLYSVDVCTSSSNIIGGTGGYASFMDDPKGNNTPSALVFAIPNWGWGGAGTYCPNKTGGPENNSPICVQYGYPGNSALKENRWAIVNARANALPHGMKFNVFIINTN